MKSGPKVSGSKKNNMFFCPQSEYMRIATLMSPANCSIAVIILIHQYQHATIKQNKVVREYAVNQQFWMLRFNLPCEQKHLVLIPLFQYLWPVVKKMKDILYQTNENMWVRGGKKI